MLKISRSRREQKPSIISRPFHQVFIQIRETRLKSQALMPLVEEDGCSCPRGYSSKAVKTLPAGPQLDAHLPYPTAEVAHSQLHWDYKLRKTQFMYGDL